MMNTRTLTAIVFLSMFVARTYTRGEDQTIFVGPNLIQQSPASVPDKVENIITVFEAQTFMEGSNVTLKCDSTEIKWNELLYIVWNIRTCWIGSDFLNKTIQNFCNDGKMLLNSSDGFSLFIPKISKKDEGSYLCDVSYKGGSFRKKINISVSNFTSWLEDNNGQRVAICQAKYEESEPTLKWEPALNFSSNISYVKISNMSVMESRVYLPNAISDLKCVAIYPHKSGQQNTTYNLTNSNIIAIAVASSCFILLSLIVGYILRRKLNSLSAMKMCCKSQISTPAEDKPAQLPDVEEVEPYASYIQRVNSIYNSSAELFNA
ncbi:cell surface glycoprotein CD200 receptor 1-A isoform X2 [Paramisgurnus dabryanus]|uniref:cell surface glycoprotein CD200 receptor 1-A isoform X2 n=1 Tax=Paramisgurnus dabryanus TaxID=90735 RepID=UPI0031F46B96